MADKEGQGQGKRSLEARADAFSRLKIKKIKILTSASVRTLLSMERRAANNSLADILLPHNNKTKTIQRISYKTQPKKYV